MSVACVLHIRALGGARCHPHGSHAVSTPSEERNAGFDAVIEDHEYLKPVPIKALQAAMPPADGEQILCSRGTVRKPVLLYIGRLGGTMKGQRAFLKQTSPALVKDIEILFFTGRMKNSTELIREEMLRIAKDRGLQIKVYHDLVPLATIYKHGCEAMGLVHYVSLSHATIHDLQCCPIDVLFAGFAALSIVARTASLCI